MKDKRRPKGGSESDAKKHVPTQGIPVTCEGCNLVFPSKNQLFNHLSNSDLTCLSREEYATYLKKVVSAKRNWEKIAVLYGYLPGTDYRFACDGDDPCGIAGGQVSLVN
jgi:hypothetical protein